MADVECPTCGRLRPDFTIDGANKCDFDRMESERLLTLDVVDMDSIRSLRESELRRTDYLFLADTFDALEEPLKTQLINYRQDLRDVTNSGVVTTAKAALEDLLSSPPI